MGQVGIQLSPLRIYRTGNALIVAGFILGLGLTFALASTGSVPYLIVLPAAILGVITVGILLAYPLLNLMIAILGFVLMASNEAGFQVIEIAYAAYLFAFLLTWFLRHAISGRSEILTEKPDLALALFLGLLPATLVLTYFFHGDFLVAFSELISLSMLLVYFPVKHTVVHHRIGPKLMLITVVAMSVVVSIVNSFEYASDLSNATHLSHIAGSRVVENDALLTIGALMSLPLLVYARRPISLLFSASAVALTFAGLIMTQARGSLAGVYAWNVRPHPTCPYSRTNQNTDDWHHYQCPDPWHRVYPDRSIPECSHRGDCRTVWDDCYIIHPRSVSCEPIPRDPGSFGENCIESPDRIRTWCLLCVLRYRPSINRHGFVCA